MIIRIWIKKSDIKDLDWNVKNMDLHSSDYVWYCLLMSEIAKSFHVVDDDLSDENVRHTVRQLWEHGGTT